MYAFMPSPMTIFLMLLVDSGVMTAGATAFSALSRLSDDLASTSSTTVGMIVSSSTIGSFSSFVQEIALMLSVAAKIAVPNRLIVFIIFKGFS